jgi:hypothetical protein
MLHEEYGPVAAGLKQRLAYCAAGGCAGQREGGQRDKGRAKAGGTSGQRPQRQRVQFKLCAI